MIKLKLYKDKNDNITGFEVVGHSGFAEKGYDIVCASVSSVVWTTICGLCEVLKIQCEVKKRDGYVLCMLPPLDEDMLYKANVLLKSLEMFYDDLLKQYRRYLMKTEVSVDV